jgi:hypothetical protein
MHGNPIRRREQKSGEIYTAAGNCRDVGTRDCRLSVGNGRYVCILHVHEDNNIMH